MKTSKESYEEESFNGDEDEHKEIANLVHKITNAWIRRKKKKGLPPKKDFKKGKSKQSEIICYNYNSLDVSNLNVQN